MLIILTAAVVHPTWFDFDFFLAFFVVVHCYLKGFIRIVSFIKWVPAFKVFVRLPDIEFVSLKVQVKLSLLFTCTGPLLSSWSRQIWFVHLGLCYLRLFIHRSNFKIILLKRLKQLFTKLIWPFPKNGQTNLEIREIRASNKGPDVRTIFVYSRACLACRGGPAI